ncbi:MAG: dephospho-CoA kinase [Lachnospiraceae bacterium]|nr:dephospho-CoA kinase [Lachnospiraceae bacterium]
MVTIGITGGVGAGKTTILEFLKKNYSCRVLVADEIAHFLEGKGQSCYNKLVMAFGNGILAADGEIDKKAFAQVLFASEENRQIVNEIVHPEVKKYILEAIEEEQKKGTPVVFLEAALLIECGYDKILDELWYIYASEEIRRVRLKASRGYSDEKVDGIFKSQLSDEIFRSKCRLVIDNGAEKDVATKQIATYMQTNFGL